MRTFNVCVWATCARERTQLLHLRKNTTNIAFLRTFIDKCFDSYLTLVYLNNTTHKMKTVTGKTKQIKSENTEKLVNAASVDRTKNNRVPYILID